MQALLGFLQQPPSIPAADPLKSLSLAFVLAVVFGCSLTAGTLGGATGWMIGGRLASKSGPRPALLAVGCFLCCVMMLGLPIVCGYHASLWWRTSAVALSLATAAIPYLLRWRRIL